MVGRLLEHVPAALAHWDGRDPTLARLARAHPLARAPARRRSAFAMLVESLVHQQVSMAAARTIYGRLRTACGGRITPQAVLKAGPRRLRSAGLSRQKRDYVVDLAKKVAKGDVDLRRIARSDDATAIEVLTQVRGVGEWTAKMFLLFHLQRPDILAEDDLGLQLAVADAYAIPMARAKRFLRTKGPAWSPYASLASLFLWRSRDGATPPATNDS